MLPIEQVPLGTLVFLPCGCAGFRFITHPTGEAALIKIQKTCEAHPGPRDEVRSLRRGELVSPYVRPQSV